MNSERILITKAYALRLSRVPPTFKPVVHLRVTKARQHESYDDIKPGLTVA